MYWFKTKKYGYGWVPSSWQGWLILFLYGALIGATVASDTVYFHQINKNLPSLFAEVGLYTCILIVICVKTGEPARWRWGNK